MKKVRVIGGGASGLVTAYYMRKAGFAVEVLEASPQLGGLISTHRHTFGLVESAANGLINSATVEDLFADLGLNYARRLPQRKRRYIFRGKPQRWPLTLGGSLSLLGHVLPKMFRKADLKPKPQETVVEWGRRCLGREAVDYLLAPALTGVYAGNPEKMSANLILGDLFAGKSEGQQKRELKQKGTVAPEQGMGQLVEALRSWLQAQGVSIRLETPVSLDLDTDQDIQIIATNLHSAGRLLSDAGVEFGQKLLDCEMIPLVSVTVFLEPSSLSLRGFGCLFPQGEGFNSLGTLFNHCVFENRSDVASQTWILGGALHPDVVEWSDADILSALIDDHRRLHHRRPQLLGQQITRWPKAIPHYDVRLEQTIADLHLPEHVYLSGNYMGRIGLAKIIERAKDLSEDLKSRYIS